MTPSDSATIFHVANLDASLRYYIEVLGFQERFRFGDYAGVEYGEVQIHLSGPHSTNKRAIGQGSIYIFCADVDGYHAVVAEKGAAIQAPPKDYEYGMRDFVIKDPDGNLIGMGQETRGNATPPSPAHP
jgi:predicted enzyme related to lactoylglutathione lyase